MQLLVDIAILIVKLLVKIGDVVLVIGNFLKNSLTSGIKKASNQLPKSFPKRTKVHTIYPKPASHIKKHSNVLKKKALSSLNRFKKNSEVFIKNDIRALRLFVKKLSHLVFKLGSLLTLTTRGLFSFIVLFLKRSVHVLVFPFRIAPFLTKKLFAKKQKKKKKRARASTPASISFFYKFRYFLAGAFFSCVLIFIPLLVILFLQDLPNPNQLTLRHIPQTTKIFDRHGTLLYQMYAAQNRTVISLSKIPKHLKNATIAAEDKDFYSHPGFDIKAIARSIIENVSGGSLQGGSTITQQLIKSALLTSETTIERKVKEIILAFWSERIYTKDQILEMYFNQVPYGGTAWGIEAASEVYFGKNVEDLSLSESAFLAGIPRAPTIYSPFGETPTVWKRRHKEVLDRMVKLGYISEKQRREALSETLAFKTPQTPLHAPYFVMYMKELLVSKYGLSMVERGGLTITTSLDLKLNNAAQAIVTDEVEKYAYLNLTNGAAVVTNPKNGDILAMIGGKDYTQEKSGNVNVTTAHRQPGSSIKVVTYAASLSRGFTAATIMDDSRITYKIPGSTDYTPVNYDGRFHGRMPLRIALANSYNIPAVKTLNTIGVPTMIQVGKAMGISGWNEKDRYGLSLTLGAGEVTMLDMAMVYGTLANSGKRVDLNPILKITDAKGNVLEEKNPQEKRVLDEGVTYILSDILADNQARSREFGSNSLLNIPGFTVSVKTGTSDDKRDNWTIGYTPTHVVTVWVGNNDNSPMSQYLASGITGAAPIWNRIMTSLLVGKQDEKPSTPQNIVRKPCSGRMEYFVLGTEATAPCGSFALPFFSPTRNP